MSGFARHIIVSVLPVLLPAMAVAEDTRTQIFDPSFKTLKVQVEGDFFSPPVIMLGTDRRITISFDEMGDDRSYLRYTLTHCDERWQPSGLLDSEMLDGFNEAEVTDYSFSANTFRHYVNYHITIPGEGMRPLLSGNYLLRVYREDDMEVPVLQARFAISEERVGVSGSVSTITDRGANDMWQQLSFKVHTGEYEVRDAYGDVTVVVEQNGVEQPQSLALKPIRMSPGSLVYEHSPGLVFPAGNEYRRFETVRTDYAGMHVDSNAYEDDGYTAILQTDYERASRPYSYDSTQQGRFKIDEYNSTDPELGADYVLTRFTLDFPRVMNGDVYVDGEFTHHLADDSSRMTYNEATGLYELTMLLKQGSYNYRYVLKGEDAGLPTASPVEGDKYETQNQYTVKVFHRVPGSRYTRLIGSATL